MFVPLTHCSSQECDYSLDLRCTDSMAKLPARDTEFDRKRQRMNDSPQQNRGTQEMTHQDLTVPEISTAQTLPSRGVVALDIGADSQQRGGGGGGSCFSLLLFFNFEVCASISPYLLLFKPPCIRTLNKGFKVSQVMSLRG